MESQNNTECAIFSTPLDYGNPSAGNASLGRYRLEALRHRLISIDSAVIRYKATKSPRIGTLWTNPGGPGGSGVDALSSGDGELISKITGGYYDIASSLLLNRHSPVIVTPLLYRLGSARGQIHVTAGGLLR